MTTTRRLRSTTLAVPVALLLGALALLIAVAQSASAQASSGWAIRQFNVDIHVLQDGSFEVVEDIAVTFREGRRGIFRQIPVRYDLQPDAPVPDGTVEDWYRGIELIDLTVESDSGAPTDTQVTDPGWDGRDLVVRIGDEDTTITGDHRYRISYRVEGALDTGEAGAADLYWNATGERWDVPIEQAEVVVSGAGIDQATCFSGRYGSPDACDTTNLDGSRVRFTSQSLPPGSGLTVAARFTPGQITVGDPLIERWPTLASEMTGSPLAWPLAAAVAILGAAGLGALGLREGRDRVARGTSTATGRVDAARPDERRRGLFEPRPIAVEFRPPDDLRPGELGLIVDERVDPVDITATVLDLAVRGYLTIEEVEEPGILWTSKTDWILRRTESPEETATAADDRADARELNRYESRLLNALFASGEEVRVSELSGTFASDYALVETDLYLSAQTHGWFSRRPDHVRSTWLVAGFVIAALGVVMTVLLTNSGTRIGVVGVPVALLGFVLAAGHRWMPRRTARGSDLLTRTLGFREFIETADAERLRFAEAEGSFERYLPYATVFGVTDRWAKAFEALGVDVWTGVGGWYVGHSYLNAARFTAGMNDFSAAAATSLTTMPRSTPGSGGAFGGGGFSGGGFGGGGGGSW